MKVRIQIAGSAERLPPRLQFNREHNVLMKSAKLLFFAAALFTASASAPAQNYELRSVTIANGGGSSIGGSYNLSDTIGQPVLGTVSGGTYLFQLGIPNHVATPSVGPTVDLTLAANRTNVLTTENQISQLTLTVSNQGSSNATSVQLVVSLPGGLRVPAATNSAGTC